MTNRTKFIIGILLLLGIVFAIEYRMTKKFVWIPTYSHTDAQPFGCMLFDSLMQASLPNGYAVSKKTIWQMRHDSVFTQKRSLLIATDDYINNSDIRDLFGLVENGHTVLVAAKRLYNFADTLQIDYHYNSDFNISNIAGRNIEKVDLCWTQDSAAYRGHPLSVSLYNQLIPFTLEGNDSIACDTLITLIEYNDNKEQVEEHPVALSFKRGKGELILVSAPLLFTNYMTISGQGSLMQARLMDRLKAHPVIRMESYVRSMAQTESSQFYVFLQQPPLRWALYLTFITILLFCIFTARRRQRVIPVIQKPQNMNLEFVRLIGSLYWQQHDNAGLLAKKLAYATEEIRRQKAQISIEDEEFLKEIRGYSYGGYVLTDKTLKYYIKELNRIMQSL
jgi:hypothetical protein